MSTSMPLYAGDVSVGTVIPEVVRIPSYVQLFRFSAATSNAHRIHFDQKYAEQEGYPDVLVQSHLHGSLLAQTVIDWAGPGARLRKFRWQNRQLATPQDELRYTGTVTSVDGALIECALEETNQLGELCAPAWATVELPTRE